LRLAIRVDASSDIGSGHAVRCVTLAKALQQAFKADNILLKVDVVITRGADMLNDAFKAAGFSVIHVNDIYHNVSHIKADIWIVDHYQLDAEFETPLVNSGALVVVIDDLANRQHNCHLLIDANLTNNAEHRYNTLVTNNCVQLIGPKYALLREEFYHVQKQMVTRTPDHILICFGGSDPANTTSMAIDALKEVKELPLTADVVIGAGNTHKQTIIEQVQLLDNVTLHVDSQNMAELMCKASVMIGAGGSMHWERCICDLPGLIITIADNQREATQCLASRYACEYIGHVTSVNHEVIALALRNYFVKSGSKRVTQKRLNQIVPLDGGAASVSKEIIYLINTKNDERGLTIEEH
jgi:UDP-2,4-diacetamido-2,4,6-trideoxy-beta-L-altropyranose hydrolase